MAIDRDDLCIQAQRELKNDPDNTHIPVSKAALFLGCSESTLNHLRLDGGGPSFKYIGNRVFYPLGELRRYVDGPLFANTTEARLHTESIKQSYCLQPTPGFELHPFWARVSTGKILGSVLQTKQSLRVALLSSDIDVVWMPCSDALLTPWEVDGDFEREWLDLTKGLNTLDISSFKLKRLENDDEVSLNKIRILFIGDPMT